MRLPHIIVLVLLLTNLPGCSKTRDRASDQARQSVDSTMSDSRSGTFETAFGLSCLSGDSLILFEDNSRPAPTSLYAVCQTEQPIPLSFLRHQQAENRSGRITARNFQSIPGPIFLSHEYSLPPDQTILIVSSHFLAHHRPLLVGDLGCVPLDTMTIRRIETERRLRVQFSWTLCRLGPSARMALVQYLPADSAQLVSLVLIRTESLAFEDYIGDRSEEGSVWRVDDGGAFNPHEFRIIAAFDSVGSLSIARSWAGQEGDNAVLYSVVGKQLVPILTAYRYWAPE
ncbi:MAG TPA: hypothetical protein DEP53_19260 [Bacteroidetes bacterium]|nr:MAG: hypothetical protein A2X66_09810 [Ignavibacteria bacterium GWA2_54_16]HCA81876.1 hypothetical protein [Bacteroidota bacterium]